MRWNDSRGLRVRQFWREQLPSTPTLMLHCSWNTTGNCSKCSRQVFVQGRWRLVNMFSMCRWFKFLLILQYADGTTPRTYFSYSCLYVCHNAINGCECPSAVSSIAIDFYIFMSADSCWDPVPCHIFNHGVGTGVRGIKTVGNDDCKTGSHRWVQLLLWSVASERTTGSWEPRELL